MISEAKYKAKYLDGLITFSPNQMLQKLPIALALVKSGNTSESLQNEIRQVIDSLCPAKEITKN